MKPRTILKLPYLTILCSLTQDSHGAFTQRWEPVDLTHTTNLFTSARSGDSEIDIFDLSDLYAEELESRLEGWFDGGDVVVFDSEGSNQEMKEVVSANLLTIDWPLENNHTHSTLIAVVPESLFEAIDRQEQVEVVQIIHNKNEQILRLAVRLPYLSLGRFESSTDMTNCQSLTPLSVQGSLLVDDTLMVTYPGETIELTIDIQGLDTLKKLFIRLRDPGED